MAHPPLCMTSEYHILIFESRVLAIVDLRDFSPFVAQIRIQRKAEVVTLRTDRLRGRDDAGMELADNDENVAQDQWLVRRAATDLRPFLSKSTQRKN